jgi:hypothetical protein
MKKLFYKSDTLRYHIMTRQRNKVYTTRWLCWCCLGSVRRDENFFHVLLIALVLGVRLDDLVHAHK